LPESKFACLALLEDEACQLYEVMVAKSEDPAVSLLLDVILQESRTHRELFRHASSICEHTSSSLADCSKQMGTLFVHSVEFIRSIRIQVSDGMPIDEAAGKLVKFEEDVANEEDVTLLYASLTSIATLDIVMKRILGGIAQDERHHAELLRLILDLKKHVAS